MGVFSFWGFVLYSGFPPSVASVVLVLTSSFACSKYVVRGVESVFLPMIKFFVLLEGITLSWLIYDVYNHETPPPSDIGKVLGGGCKFEWRNQRNCYATAWALTAWCTNTAGDYQSDGLHQTNAVPVPESDPKEDVQTVAMHRDERTKFRSFVIAYNKEYGYLLLRAYKKGKGLHHQLPGGHLDRSEMVGVSFEEAAKRAALRELGEETGLKVDEDRLKFLKLGIKNRVYFQLLLTMEDSLHHDAEYDEISTLTTSLNEDQEFYLKISHEHNGFVFEKDIGTAIQMIQAHSGGKNSDALTVYAQKAKHERRRRTRSHSHSSSSSSSSKRQKKSVSSRRKNSSSSSSSGGGRKKKRKKRGKEEGKDSPKSIKSMNAIHLKSVKSSNDKSLKKDSVELKQSINSESNLMMKSQEIKVSKQSVQSIQSVDEPVVESNKENPASMTQTDALETK